MSKLKNIDNIIVSLLLQIYFFFIIGNNYKNDISYLYKSKLILLLKKRNFYSNMIDYIDKNIKIEGYFYHYENNMNLDYLLYKSTVDNIVYVVFKSTELTFIDFFKDIHSLGNYKLNFIETNIGVYSGYYKLFDKKSIKKIYNFINNNINSKIIITGQSKGGSLAQLASYIINKKFKDINININVIAIAPLRPGNFNFKEYIESNSNINLITIINSDDIIPYLPFTIKQTYYTIGKVILLIDDNTNKIYDSKLNYNIKFNFTIKFISKHFFNIYFRRLYQLI